MGFIDLVFGDRGEKKRALLERARKHFRQGRVEKALEHAERAIKLDPDGAESRETLGRVYFRMGLLAWTDGSPGDAIECFTDAARLLNDPLVLFHRGLVYRDTRQYLKAIEDFSRILRSEEIHVVPLATYAAFCRGICYREKGEHRFAAKDFTTCILTDEGSPLRHRFFAHRALCRAALGETREALEDIAAAEAIAPRSAEVAHAKEMLASISAPVARPALPPGRSQSSAPSQRFVPAPTQDELLDDLEAPRARTPGARPPLTPPPPAPPPEETVYDLDEEPIAAESYEAYDELEETTGRRLMPGLGTHVGRTPARGGDEAHDPGDADWTLIPDSSPTIRRGDAQPAAAATAAPRPSPPPPPPAPSRTPTAPAMARVRAPDPEARPEPDRPEPARPERVEPAQMAKPAPPTTRTTTTAPATTTSTEATVPELPAFAPPRPDPQEARERLAELKRKRDQAFAERAELFGDEREAGAPRTEPPEDVLRIQRRPSAPSRTGSEPRPAADARAVRPSTAPARAAEAAAATPAAAPAREASAAEPPRAAPLPPLSEKALRCLRKLNQLVEDVDTQPHILEDVDFCVDFLLVVARLRELPRGEKKAAVATVGLEALQRYEALESQVREALLAAPEARPARELAEEVLQMIDEITAARLAAAQLPESPAAEPLRACIQRFQSLSRAQKYLFMDRCGQKRFAKFIDYFIAMGGAEQ